MKMAQHLTMGSSRLTVIQLRQSTVAHTKPDSNPPLPRGLRHTGKKLITKPPLQLSAKTFLIPSLQSCLFSIKHHNSWARPRKNYPTQKSRVILKMHCATHGKCSWHP